MVEPRVVYACNHYVAESFNEIAEIFMFDDGNRRPENERYSRQDKLLPNTNIQKDGIITINSAYCSSVSECIDDNEQKVPLMSSDCKVYTQGEDFDIVSVWGEVESNPERLTYVCWSLDVEPPEMYMICMDYTRVVSELYEEHKCPRCGGEGWYTGVFEDGNINPSVVSGANKLVQCFLKYIYTKKLESGYGSRITSIPGKYNLDNGELANMAIQSELMSFKDYYTNKISAEILSGRNVSDSEKLVSQVVSNIEIDKENRAIKVVVTFATKDGSLNSVNLMVANL